jgi:hypothetical protein
VNFQDAPSLNVPSKNHSTHAKNSRKLFSHEHFSTCSPYKGVPSKSNNKCIEGECYLVVRVFFECSNLNYLHMMISCFDAFTWKSCACNRFHMTIMTKQKKNQLSEMVDENIKVQILYVKTKCKMTKGMKCINASLKLNLRLTSIKMEVDMYEHQKL